MLALFHEMVGSEGVVVGIDYIKELTDMSERNVRKNYSSQLNNGEIVVVSSNFTDFLFFKLFVPF